MLARATWLIALTCTFIHLKTYGQNALQLNPPYVVEIYSALFCGFCEKVKTSLEQHGIRYTEYGTTFSTDNYQEMLARTDGEEGVPRIFINGHYIGGYRQFNAISSRQLEKIATKSPIRIQLK